MSARTDVDHHYFEFIEINLTVPIYIYLSLQYFLVDCDLQSFQDIAEFLLRKLPWSIYKKDRDNFAGDLLNLHTTVEQIKSIS